MPGFLYDNRMVQHVRYINFTHPSHLYKQNTNLTQKEGFPHPLKARLPIREMTRSLHSRSVWVLRPRPDALHLPNCVTASLSTPSAPTPLYLHPRTDGQKGGARQA